MTDAAGFAQAIEIARNRIAAAPQATKQRFHILWASARQARDLTASKEIHDAFLKLAIDVNLIDRNGRWTGADVRDNLRRYGAEDVSTAITWALRGCDPFEKGPLK
jgi:Asp-tRNA(Asn)/Glu-tRNA(Gln) amidotransferase B subunit